jgi:hypothetical protein
MKTLALFFVLVSSPAFAQYAGSSFSQVWSQVASDPYTQLPRDRVTLGSFFGFLRNHLYEASRRTLTTRDDLLPWFRKLVHPTGICLAGTWNITADTPWSGHFKKGTRALFIARASDAFGNTERGHYRAFGFAGKIFPTLDPNAVVETANIFTIEDLGGTLRDHFLDAQNENDILKISITPQAVWSTGIGAAALKAFAAADRTIDPTQPTIRQLYPIAELGEPEPDEAREPRWILITGDAGVPRVDKVDLREELRVANYPRGLRFVIYAADVGVRDGAKAYVPIGHIQITADATSDSCDHRLHFPHPPYRH